LKVETVIFLTAEILPIKSEKIEKRKERSIRVSITRFLLRGESHHQHGLLGIDSHCTSPSV
jgi:hypothetical protein